MKYIAGQDRTKITMLPAAMDDYVTENNPVRMIDTFVDSLDWDGLHVVLSPTGITKRRLIARGKKIPLNDAIIAEELLQLGRW